MNIQDITTEDAFRAAIDTDQLVLILFTTESSRSCQRLLPELEILARRYIYINFYTCDAVECKDLHERCAVTTLPTVFLCRNRKALGKVEPSLYANNPSSKNKGGKIVGDMISQIRDQINRLATDKELC